MLKIRHLANIQCTKAEAAGALLAGERTFSSFLHLHIKAREAWESGRHEGRVSLRRDQWKRAQRSPAMAIWLGKKYLGQKDNPKMDPLLMLAKRPSEYLDGTPFRKKMGRPPAAPSADIRRRAPGGGRKPKLVCGEDTILKIRHLAKIQCTREEAAGALLAGERTFSSFLHLHIKAREAWESGRDEGRASLRRLQLKHAQRSATMAIWLGKQYLGQKDTTQIGGNPKMDALLMLAEARERKEGKMSMQLCKIENVQTQIDGTIMT